MENFHLSIHMASWKESMINRLSNLINRNGLAAKYHRVYALTTMHTSLHCPDSLLHRSTLVLFLLGKEETHWRWLSPLSLRIPCRCEKEEGKARDNEITRASRLGWGWSMGKVWSRGEVFDGRTRIRRSWPARVQGNFISISVKGSACAFLLLAI